MLHRSGTLCNAAGTFIAFRAGIGCFCRENQNMDGANWTVLQRVIGALLQSVRRFNRKGGWVLSSHIAMSMMLALFPFLLFVVSLAGTFSQDVDIDDLVELIFGAWPEAIAGPIATEMRAVLTATNGRLMTVGGVLAIYFASNGVDAVRVAMTLAYRDVDHRPFWQARLLCLAFVVVGGVLVILAATVGLALPFYLSLVTDATPGPVEAWFTSDHVSWLFTMGAPLLAVTACHVWLPGHRHSLMQMLPGILVTLVLWVSATWGFSYYITRFASYSAVYAGLAGTMAALIFMYLMAAILIFGAEFNGVLAGSDDPAKA
ncbi:MAG: membrane protein [Paracoccaceae bacterium]|jgi:membrane protein